MTDEYCVLLVRRKDGTAEVGGVEYVLVPKEPTDAMLSKASSATPRNDYHDMLSAAAIDLSGLPVVPKRRTVQAIDCHAEGLNEGFNDALDAIGAGK